VGRRQPRRALSHRGDPGGPAADAEQLRERARAVADVDELVEKYLEGRRSTESEIRAAIRKATCDQDHPVLCGSAFKNKGVQPLLDAVVDLPAVADRQSRRQRHRPDTTRRAAADDDAPFSALAFKIMTDPYVGTLTFFRVYSA
jgi:elongation factor G